MSSPPCYSAINAAFKVADVADAGTDGGAYFFFERLFQYVAGRRSIVDHDTTDQIVDHVNCVVVTGRMLFEKHTPRSHTSLKLLEQLGFLVPLSGRARQTSTSESEAGVSELCNERLDSQYEVWNHRATPFICSIILKYIDIYYQ